MPIKKIGLDAGHGMFVAGKQTPDGIKENYLNDIVCDKVMKILSGYDVEIIRTDNNEGNVDESLTSRRTMYVNAKVDAFVSIHHNATSSAWLGPESTTTGLLISSSITSTNVLLLPSSIPFAIQITGIFSSIKPLRLLEATLIT